jgi:hypothetical protein
VSVQSAEAILMDAIKQLRQRWDRIKDRWDDPASRQIQKEFIDPLEPMVRAAMGALDHTGSLMSAARRECSDD